jgi:hypothetical protein
MKMDDLIETLRALMAVNKLSPEQAAGYIGCSGMQIRRWLKGATPKPLSRQAIRFGIARIKQAMPRFKETIK